MKIIDQTRASIEPEQWECPQKILVILAHPDDPEFFCGATIARWTHAGHYVKYCLLTCGDKGTKDRSLSTNDLCEKRKIEQMAAANVLGVDRIRFLDYEDGYLVPDLRIRKDITRLIRQECPDVVVTCDPSALFFGTSYVNHPDHRAAGHAVIDAIFPAARDHLYFPELLHTEKLEPHIVRELWITLTNTPNVVLDVTQYWGLKIEALKMHASQIGDPNELEERMRNRLAVGSRMENPRYEEAFMRINFA
jgi:LmbE family N-acetylglucosaminyl deacetylase